tara:strand:- start:228 stop:374 length:147 start_codon:yes stop_codon:yes gene_type:complete
MNKGYFVIFSKNKKYKPSQAWYMYKKDALLFQKTLKKDGWNVMIVKGK